jgi:signal peptidase I
VDQANLDAHEDALRHADRGTLLLATSFGFLLFLSVVACVPGLPANLRIRSHPSASMLPNQPDHAMRDIKRVVDLPGDCVQMIKGRLSLNREPAATEPVVGAAAATETSPLRTSTERLPGAASNRIKQADGGNGPDAITPAFAVPAGNLFVPSDDRANSIDSRHQTPNFGRGLVPTEPLDGRVIATLGGAGE